MAGVRIIFLAGTTSPGFGNEPFEHDRKNGILFLVGAQGTFKNSPKKGDHSGWMGPSRVVPIEPARFLLTGKK